MVGADILSAIWLSQLRGHLLIKMMSGEKTASLQGEAGFPVAFVFMEEQHLLFHVTAYLVVSDVIVTPFEGTHSLCWE